MSEGLAGSLTGTEEAEPGAFPTIACRGHFREDPFPPRNLLSNPFNCNCHLAWLGKWLRKRRIVSGNPRCQKPFFLKEIPIQDVAIQDFTCEGETAEEGRGKGRGVPWEENSQAGASAQIPLCPLCLGAPQLCCSCAQKPATSKQHTCRLKQTTTILENTEIPLACPCILTSIKMGATLGG